MDPNQRSRFNEDFVEGDGIFDYNEAPDETIDVHGLEVQNRLKLYFSREGKMRK